MFVSKIFLANLFGKIVVRLLIYYVTQFDILVTTIFQPTNKLKDADTRCLLLTGRKAISC